MVNPAIEKMLGSLALSGGTAALVFSAYLLVAMVPEGFSFNLALFAFLMGLSALAALVPLIGALAVAVWRRHDHIEQHPVPYSLAAAAIAVLYVSGLTHFLFGTTYPILLLVGGAACSALTFVALTRRSTSTPT